MPSLLLLTILLLLAACGGGDDPTGPGGEPATPRPLGFRYVNRLPQPDDLNAVSESGGRAIAAGAAGALVLRRDVTSDWERIASPTRGTWTDLLMLDAGTVLGITGEDGIWLSEDGGESWELVHAAPGFRKVAHRAGRSVAVGVTAAFSTDLRNWTEATVPPDGIFPCMDVTFAGDRIWALKRSTLFRSDDGGAVWLPFTTGGGFNCMAFADQDFGVVGTSGGAILSTTNGSTFTLLQELRETVVDVDFATPTDGVLLTRELRVGTSATRGQSWTTTAFDGIEELPNDIEALGLGEYLVVGSDGLIAEVTANGTVIEEISSGFPFDVNVLAFANGSSGLALADIPDVLLLRTTDGGFSFEPLTSPLPAPVDLEFVDGGTALLLDRSGLLLRSDDLGDSWTATNAPAVATRSGLLVVDPGTWLVCGANSVGRTTDGGAVWTTTEITDGPVPLDDVVRFPGTSTLLAFSSSELFVSDDAGETWAGVEGQLVSGFDYACPDANTAIAVSDNIYRSTDRGRTWTEVYAAEAPLVAVAFLDALHGVAAGERGVVVETLDGGRTWNEVDVAGAELRDVAIRDAGSLFVVGEDGTVIAGLPSPE